MLNISNFFSKNQKIAICFSGGIDSSYLLFEAIRYGIEVKPYFVRTSFCKHSDITNAISICKDMNLDLDIIDVDIFSYNKIISNKMDRCYQCKIKMLGSIVSKAKSDGFFTVVDGTNASDLENSRPGIMALREFGVLSPLRMYGLTKIYIRHMSREYGLITQDMPSNSCLATRILHGTQINKEILHIVDESEDVISAMGFSDFRIRTNGTDALLQFNYMQYFRAIRHFKDIQKAISPYYHNVVMDCKCRGL